MLFDVMTVKNLVDRCSIYDVATNLNYLSKAIITFPPKTNAVDNSV